MAFVSPLPSPGVAASASPSPAASPAALPTPPPPPLVATPTEGDDLPLPRDARALVAGLRHLATKLARVGIPPLWTWTPDVLAAAPPAAALADDGAAATATPEIMLRVHARTAVLAARLTALGRDLSRALSAAIKLRTAEAALQAPVGPDPARDAVADARKTVPPPPTAAASAASASRSARNARAPPVVPLVRCRDLAPSAMAAGAVVCVVCMLIAMALVPPA
ncbi:hypothetical protein CXG81DRAFT_27870 [Caulochytrium protostelioides]|uniref:Uncharacterized protein n=1 Tax=Caulochytrium protostelioides TaxID=1555241 RepID=A0A4P9X2Y7_9FUNG|nr:hypothetical protein CXG81DRAFT_27870 [Caulochytrium protostelioides]|eukprot:RKO99363.1 hypothetical protein CXG81DRAFT_27870 [Caulochytrium protostelioides]